MARSILALFDTRAEARSLVEDLVQSGVNRDRISVFAQRVPGELENWEGPITERDAVVGAEAGAVLGGIGGLLAGVGAFAIPGLGPVIAIGPILAAFAGAGVGATAGGLVGGLVGMGVGEPDASAYAEGVRRGGTLVIINPPDDQESLAREVVARHRPVNLADRAQEWRHDGWQGPGQDPGAGESFHGDYGPVGPMT